MGGGLPTRSWPRPRRHEVNYVHVVSLKALPPADGPTITRSAIRTAHSTSHAPAVCAFASERPAAAGRPPRHCSARSVWVRPSSSVFDWTGKADLLRGLHSGSHFRVAVPSRARACEAEALYDALHNALEVRFRAGWCAAHLGPLGCKCTMTILSKQEHRRKLSDKIRTVVMVGYHINCKSWCVFDPETGSVHVMGDV